MLPARVSCAPIGLSQRLFKSIERPVQFDQYSATRFQVFGLRSGFDVPGQLTDLHATDAENNPRQRMSDRCGPFRIAAAEGYRQLREALPGILDTHGYQFVDRRLVAAGGIGE